MAKKSAKGGKKKGGKKSGASKKKTQSKGTKAVKETKAPEAVARSPNAQL